MESCTVTFVKYCSVTNTVDLDAQQSNTSHWEGLALLSPCHLWQEGPCPCHQNHPEGSFPLGSAPSPAPQSSPSQYREGLGLRNKCSVHNEGHPHHPISPVVSMNGQGNTMQSFGGSGAGGPQYFISWGGSSLAKIREEMAWCDTEGTVKPGSSWLWEVGTGSCSCLQAPYLEQ